MKVLFVDQFAAIGGGQRSLLALLQVAADAGHTVELLAPGGGALEAEVRRKFGDAVPFHPLEEPQLRRGRKSLGDFFRLARASAALLTRRALLAQFDLIYINGPRLYPSAWIASWFLKRRFIYHVRLEHSPAEKEMISWIARGKQTSAVVFNSPYNLGMFLSAKPGLRANLRLGCIENCLYPPYDTMPFTRRFSAATARRTVAIIGRVSPEKGHQILERMSLQFPQLDFVILGDLRPQHQDYLDELLRNCGKNVRYAGFAEDVPAALAKHNVQVSLVPSLWNESFGLVAIESMAASCLTIVSDRGMLPEIARRTGAWMFQDPAELETLLQRVANGEEAQLNEVAQAQYEAVQREFGFSRFAQRIQRLLTRSEFAEPTAVNRETCFFGGTT